ncbi:helix-turn-helix domain-containing protein [Cellulomonas sp. APG4]|uniref:helix-turn-helix transcriptional regulator n=1 Tax=Cellulomonas sp. APG4 TaxID=1538656 RepID=UPI00137A85FF|nr:helix-turn-helix domain-containing protein [Cellulomonas sp. APG4]NCT92262.1 helix-turn-helix domain-containing protein [Cellulomonas sp. APG4]
MPVPRQDPTLRLPPGERRRALLAVLREHDDGLGVADLAAQVGLHANTVRAHLEALVRTGHATRRSENRGRGRPREVYRATGAPEGDRRYQVLAQMLMARLAELAEDPQAEAVRAGHAWGAAAAPLPTVGSPDRPTPGAEDEVRAAVGPVLRMLEDTGFAPRLAPDARTIELHHCPFLELAEQQPDVVCGVHLGLVQGALDRLGSPVAATRILPFVRPGLCLAELSGPETDRTTVDEVAPR